MFIQPYQNINKKTTTKTTSDSYF